MLRSHLDRFKWKEAAFNTEQLRSQRWMIGSQPKASSCPAELRKVLCVTNLSQVLHLKLVAYCFAEDSRRLRASARARVRLSSEQFDSFADYSCFYAAMLMEARLLSTWMPEKEEAIMKSFYQKFLGLFFQSFSFSHLFQGVWVKEQKHQGVIFFILHWLRDYKSDVEAIVASKLPSWKLSHFGLRTDMVEPPQPAVEPTSAAELMDLEEQAHQARFREMRAKIAQDMSNMTAYNAQATENQRRNHVVHVMHERAQAQIGKEYLDLISFFFVERFPVVSPMSKKVWVLFKN